MSYLWLCWLLLEFTYSVIISRELTLPQLKTFIGATDVALRNEAWGALGILAGKDDIDGLMKLAVGAKGIGAKNVVQRLRVFLALFPEVIESCKVVDGVIDTAQQLEFLGELILI